MELNFSLDVCDNTDFFQEALKAGKGIKEENVFKYFALKYKSTSLFLCLCVLNGCLHTVSYWNWQALFSEFHVFNQDFKLMN